jgi:hypothetical protein
MRTPTPLSGPITPVQAVELRNNLAVYIKREKAKLYGAFELGVKVQQEMGMAREISDALNEKRYGAFLDLVAEDLMKSEIVLWPLDLFDAAARGSKCFENQPLDSSVWARKNQFWLFNWDVIKNKGLFISECMREKALPAGENTQDYGMLGMVIAPDPENKCAYLTAFMITDFSQHARFYNTTVDQLTVSPLWIDVGKSMVEGRNCPPMSDGSIFMALSRFLDLKLTTQNPHEWSKREGKQLSRNNIDPPSLRVVRLRRPEQKDSQGSRDVDWSCQWLVEGHWRMQWFPSEGVHKPVYVHSYVKGPEDKPLKAKTETIFSVVR